MLSTGIIDDISDVVGSTGSTDVVFRTSTASCVAAVSVYCEVLDEVSTFSMLVLAGTYVVPTITVTFLVGMCGVVVTFESAKTRH